MTEIDAALAKKVEALVADQFAMATLGYTYQKSETDAHDLYQRAKFHGGIENAIIHLVRDQLGRVAKEMAAHQLAAPGRPSVFIELRERHGQPTLFIETRLPTAAADVLEVPRLERRLEQITQEVSALAERLRRHRGGMILERIADELDESCQRARR